MAIILSDVLHASSDRGSERGLVLKHWCPGCKMYHLIHIEKPNAQGCAWTWDDNVERPTIHPSINIIGHCHYFIIDGQIQYCGDSNHRYAGQTVPLPAIGGSMYMGEDDDHEYLNDLDFGS